MSLIGSKLELQGADVAVLKGSQEHKFALWKQAIPIPYETIDDILASVLKGSF